MVCFTHTHKHIERYRNVNEQTQRERERERICTYEKNAADETEEETWKPREEGNDGMPVR